MHFPIRLKTIIFCISLIFLSISPGFSASIPQLINYNGTLTDTGGTPVPDGNYDVTFKIYDASTAGTVLWTETWNTSTSQVIVSGGNFNAMLGAHNPIPLSFFSDHSVAYLGVTVGTDSEMMPRQKITSVGYAFAAENGVPKGGIMMWSGAINQIPTGWALCDGTNGTPNLKNRFIAGAGDTYTVGTTGGEAAHVLTAAEMPSHTHIQDAHAHGITDPGHAHIPSINGGASGTTRIRGGGPDNMYNQGLVNSNTTGISINNTIATNQNTGGGAAHENRPPFYALAYIMKL